MRLCQPRVRDLRRRPRQHLVRPRSNESDHGVPAAQGVRSGRGDDQRRGASLAAVELLLEALATLGVGSETVVGAAGVHAPTRSPAIRGSPCRRGCGGRAGGGRLVSHVTSASDQLLASRSACSVRSGADDAAYMLSTADSTTQPAGRLGSGKWTRTRKLSCGAFDCSLRMESLPLLVEELVLVDPHASASATTTTSAGQAGAASIVQVNITESRSRAASAARRKKLCSPTARPLYSTPDWQASNAAGSNGAGSSAYWNCAPGTVGDHERRRLRGVAKGTTRVTTAPSKAATIARAACCRTMSHPRHDPTTRSLGPPLRRTEHQYASPPIRRDGPTLAFNLVNG